MVRCACVNTPCCDIYCVCVCVCVCVISPAGREFRHFEETAYHRLIIQSPPIGTIAQRIDDLRKCFVDATKYIDGSGKEIVQDFDKFLDTSQFGWPRPGLGVPTDLNEMAVVMWSRQEDVVPSSDPNETNWFQYVNTVSSHSNPDPT